MCTHDIFPPDAVIDLVFGSKSPRHNRPDAVISHAGVQLANFGDCRCMDVYYLRNESTQQAFTLFWMSPKYECHVRGADYCQILMCHVNYNPSTDLYDPSLARAIAI